MLLLTRKPAIQLQYDPTRCKEYLCGLQLSQNLDTRVTLGLRINLILSVNVIWVHNLNENHSLLTQ